MPRPLHINDDGSVRSPGREAGDPNHGQRNLSPGQLPDYNAYMSQFKVPDAGPHRGQTIKDDPDGKRRVYEPMSREHFMDYHKGLANRTVDWQVSTDRKKSFQEGGQWVTRGVTQDPNPSLNNPSHWDEGGPGHTIRREGSVVPVSFKKPEDPFNWGGTGVSAPSGSDRASNPKRRFGSLLGHFFRK